MGRELQHSAEGTHWTKKNHKYIRKEGNRYIYADDANNLRRTQAMNRQGTTDYRSIGTDRAKRSQAANGVGAKNQEYAKAQSSLQRTKQLYKSTGGKAPNEYKVGGMTLKRATPAIPDTSVEKAKAITQQRNKAANGNGARNKEYAKSQNTRQSLNRQGSGKGQEYAKTQAGTTSIRARRKKAMRNQEINPDFVPYDGRKDNPSQPSVRDAKEWSESKKYRDSRDYGDIRDKRTQNKEIVSNAGKKLKDNGYFTVQNGKTVYIPSDEITMHKTTLGEKFVNSVKSKLGEISKKKDQLAKKAKDFFNRVDAKYDEARYLKKNYTKDMGYPGSHDRRGLVEDGIWTRTTGNKGSDNLRVGVEAGRKRAGIKKSGNVQGVKNDLRNKGYESTHNDVYNKDTYEGNYHNQSFSNHTPKRKENDYYNASSKQDNEAYRQSRDRNRVGLNWSSDELHRGTSAGRKRVKNKTSRNKSRNYAAKNNR